MVAKFGKQVDLLERSPGGTYCWVVVTPSPCNFIY